MMRMHSCRDLVVKTPLTSSDWMISSRMARSGWLGISAATCRAASGRARGSPESACWVGGLQRAYGLPLAGTLRQLAVYSSA